MALDEWTDEEIDAMVEVGGNSSANSIYEAHVPEGVKPGPDASVEQRTKFIRYVVGHVLHSYDNNSLVCNCMIIDY